MSPQRNSDPTYEAWKQSCKIRSSGDSFDSDPTYEAWKQYQEIEAIRLKTYSDPTYEAWKHECPSYNNWTIALFRSYL